MNVFLIACIFKLINVVYRVFGLQGNVGGVSARILNWKFSLLLTDWVE